MLKKKDEDFSKRKIVLILLSLLMIGLFQHFFMEGEWYECYGPNL